MLQKIKCNCLSNRIFYYFFTILFLSNLFFPIIAIADNYDQIEILYSEYGSKIPEKEIINFKARCLLKSKNLPCGEYESDEECQKRRRIIQASCSKYLNKWYVAYTPFKGLTYNKHAGAFAPLWSLSGNSFYCGILSEENDADELYMRFFLKYFNNKYFDSVKVSPPSYYKNNDYKIYPKSELKKARMLKTRENYLQWRSIIFVTDSTYSLNYPDLEYLVKYVTLYDPENKEIILMMEQRPEHYRSHRETYNLFSSKSVMDFHRIIDMNRLLSLAKGHKNNFIEKYYDPPIKMLTVHGFRQ